MPSIDPTFTALSLDALADAALQRAKDLGVGYADFRLERVRSQTITTRDRALETMLDADENGFGVRVIHRGAWGFASAVDLTADAAADAAERAVRVAETLGRLNSEPVEIAEEPPYNDTWVSSYEIDPFDVADDEKIAFLLGLSDTVLSSGKVAHTDASLFQVKENKFFANLEGSRIVQQRVRLQTNLYATKIATDGSFERMRTDSVPVGRGWEYCTSGYDFASDAAQLPDLLEEKLKARSVEPGRYDLVISPTNLWLTIHESIGHSTELDRALGYEANYAGTSFATIDKLGSLRYGTDVMHVTGDREVDNGLSTVGYDDEGVQQQRWDIIKEGTLVGYQLNRQMALKQGFGRSNGCAYADSPGHVPLQRMPNVTLQPSAKDIGLDDLLGGVEKGIFIVGDGSWSIDMQRYNFQFTGQRFFNIVSGKIQGQLKDVAYQSRTTDFWGSMEAVGGKDTFQLAGAFNCGKGQPGQSAPVSHGCPAALFRDVSILNTQAESGR